MSVLYSFVGRDLNLILAESAKLKCARFPLFFPFLSSSPPPQPRSKWRRDSPFTAIAPLDSIVNECLTALFGKFSLRYSGIEFTGSAAAGSCDLLAALKSFWIKRLPKYQPLWRENILFVCSSSQFCLFISFLFIPSCIERNSNAFSISMATPQAFTNR